MKKIATIMLTVILSSVLFFSGCSSSSDKNEPLPEAPSSSSEDLAALPSDTEQDTEPVSPEFELFTKNMEENMQAFADTTEERGGTLSFSTSATTWTVIQRLPLPLDSIKDQYLKGDEEIELSLFSLFLSLQSMSADAYTDMESNGFADKTAHFEFRTVEDDTLVFSSTISKNDVSYFNIMDLWNEEKDAA